MSGKWNPDASSIFSGVTMNSEDFVSVSNASLGNSSDDTRRRSSDSLSYKKPLSSDPVRSSARVKELTVNKLQFSSLRLYGRDKEISILKDIYSRSRSSRQFVLIEGQAGSGKTALSGQLDSIIKNSRQDKPAMYITGKYDQQLASQPYAGISTACRKLCELLNAKEEENGIQAPHFSLEDIRTKLRKELNSDGQILTRIIPNLLQIIGTEKEELPVKEENNGEYKEVRNRFQYVFRRFIHIISSFVHLVLGLEDLQWADLSTLELIESLIRDQEQQHLLIVGTIRADEVDSNQELLGMIQELKRMSASDGFELCTIPIESLNVEQMNQMLIDLLTSEPDTTRSLAEIVFKKTLGNPFFVVQYLKLLYDHGLLEFNFGAMKWMWDTEQIQMTTMATSNVVDLIQEKLKRLPPEVRQILPLVASLGSAFQSFLFERIFYDFILKSHQVDDSKSVGSGSDTTRLENPKDVISLCLQQGLIEEYGPDAYHWVHDKIQEACLGLITEQELRILQFHLGALLLRYISEDEMGYPIFVTVNLLNRGVSDLPYDYPRREEFAALNLRAGKKALASSSFILAADYFQKGIELLPEDPWESANYDLCLDLYSSAAEVSFCLGKFDHMQRYCEEVFSHIRHPFLDKRRAYNALLDSLGARDRMRDAADLCVEILSKLGCKFPKRGRKFYVVAGVLKLKATLKRRTAEEIAQLPLMTDESKIWAMAILNKLTTFLYHDKSVLLPLVILRGLQFTFSHGKSEYSPPICGLVGVVLAGFLGDLEGGRIYGEHAMALLQQVPNSRRVEARTIFVAHTFVLHWAHPLEISRKPLLRGYEIGMSMGDTESAMWCVLIHLGYHLLVGGSLEAFESDLKTYMYQMQEFKQMKPLASLLITWQGTLNLLGRSGATIKLEGEAMDVFNMLTDSEKVSQVVSFRRMQVMLAFYFSDYERLMNLIEEFGEGYWDKVMPGMYYVCLLTFFSAIASIFMARKTKQKKYRKLASGFIGKIKKWSSKGNPNVAHFESLVDAEMEALNGNANVALKHYEVTIFLAGRRGFINDQAIAHERFGVFHLNNCNMSEAEYHMTEASKLYQEWGAQAKVNQLQEQYTEFFSPPAEISLTD